MGPFPTAVRQLKFLVVDIDYFTKWVEAKALTTITEKNIRNFVWRNIICRYEIPRVLISDNGKQFDSNVFRDFCSELGIKNHYFLQHTYRPMGKSKSRTGPCSRSSRPSSRGQKVSGLMSYQTFYGHIILQQGHQLEKRNFDLHTELMQSSQRR